MFHIKNAIPRERFKGYPPLSVMVTMVIMGSVLFGSSSDDVDVPSIRVPRDASSALANCEKNLAASDFSKCSNFCKTLQERLTHPHQRTSWRLINTILLCLYAVTVPVSIIVCFIHIYRLKPPKPKETVIDAPPKPFPYNPGDAHAAKSGSFLPVEQSCVSLTGETGVVEDFSLDDPPASGATAATTQAARAAAFAKYNIANQGVRQETPEQKACREHCIKMRKEQKELAQSKKFKKRGPIYMPREPTIPLPAVLPDNIILGDNVRFNEEYNEMFIIGSDVDDIELEPSTVADSSNSDSTTERKPKKKKNNNNSKTAESEDKSNKAKTKSEKKEPKKKSNENPTPAVALQKKPSKEGLPEKKPSKETLPEKKPSKEKDNVSEKKTPEKKVSKENAEKKDNEKKDEDQKKSEEPTEK